MTSKLWEALDAIRTGDMCKRGRDDGDKRCAIGFLNDAHGRVPLPHEAYERDVDILASVISEVFPYRAIYPRNLRRPSIPFFNDHPDTTKADLELVFEKAAIRADEILG